MALNAVNLFATFDVTDGAQERDISPILEEAIYYDLNLLGALNIAFDSPVNDIIHYWNEEQLNADTMVLNASAASNDTTLTILTPQGLRAHVGDLLYDTTINSTEVLQVVTVTSGTSLSVTRGYNSTTAASIANAATVAIIRVEQEGSDIGTDKTLNPTVRNNNTHIFSTYDLQITGSQLARKMATNEYQDFLARQLAARAIELKIGMSRAFLYSELSSSVGSDTVYRSMAGLRNWFRGSGVTDTTSAALSYAGLNGVNKSVVDKGVFPDTLVIGTDLVGSVAGIDSSNRRLRESDTQAGYVVQEVLLNQGNMVQVVVDARVKTGDYFLFQNSKVRCRPMNGRGMFVIAGADWVDGKKRRILAEWTAEVRNPEAGAYVRNKT